MGQNGESNEHGDTGEVVVNDDVSECDEQNDGTVAENEM